MFRIATVLPVIPLHERVIVVVLVLALHLGVGAFWLMQPRESMVAINELSVSIAMQQADVVQPEPPSRPQPKPRPKAERTDKSVARPVVRELAEAAPSPVVTPAAAAPPVVTTTPVVATAPVADTEPDYKARYLNNPRPPYPMVARRMGWEGKVILNVEVLSEGACGGVNVFRSSGHEVLDNAAMNTVKSWRFIPAKRAGRSFTQWFKVPINFSLEDDEA